MRRHYPQMDSQGEVFFLDTLQVNASGAESAKGHVNVSHGSVVGILMPRPSDDIK